MSHEEHSTAVDIELSLAFARKVIECYNEEVVTVLCTGFKSALAQRSRCKVAGVTK